jgi:CheY-like chemotaxis protein
MPLRLLLAEDNKINQKLASKIFDKMGYKIDIAEDGLETLNMMDSQNYDIIFMDVQMPKMDGLEATEEIRKLYPRETGPIIVAMTANALQGDKEKCLEAGMDDFISKPIKITAIQDALIKWGGKTKKPMINSDKRG